MSPRLLLPGILLLAACGEKNSFAPPPPMPVGVQKPVVREEQTYSEFTGHIEALQVVEVRARVSGTLEEVSDGFEPGKRVKEGTVLFKIDDATYLARQATARAELKKAEANQTLAQQKLTARVNAGAGVSQIEKDAAQAEKDLADAAVTAAEANLSIATEDVDHCTIAAPISGRISELRVDQFNLVGTSEPTLLCTIVNDTSMHVYFEADERRALEFLRRRKGYEDTNRTPPEADLFLADGTEYDSKAQLELADNTLDSESGTLLVRAVVDNENGKLADGLFVRVKVPDPDGPLERVLVPSTAIQQDLAGFYVLTVGEGNKVVRKNIKLAQRVDDLRIVSSGLTGDEQVIVQGLQRVREGAPVAPKEIPTGGGASPSAKPAATPETPAGN